MCRSYTRSVGPSVLVGRSVRRSGRSGGRAVGRFERFAGSEATVGRDPVVPHPTHTHSHATPVAPQRRVNAANAAPHALHISVPCRRRRNGVGLSSSVALVSSSDGGVVFLVRLGVLRGALRCRCCRWCERCCAKRGRERERAAESST